MRIGFNFRSGDRVRGFASQPSKGTHPVRADIYGTAHFTTTAYAGRMNKLDFPVVGAVPQPDGTFALDRRSVSTGETQIFQNPNRSIGALEFKPAAQTDRWASGDYYMLEVDADGQLVVEPGRNHRKIYGTAGLHGKTRAQIATDAGVSAGAITNAWLAANPSLGSSPANALEAQVATDLWKYLQGGGVAPGSNWLLLERGYDYNRLNVSPVVAGSAESPLHPHMVGSYGTGSRPRNLRTASNGFQSRGYVFRDLSELSAGANAGSYWMFAHIENSEHEMGGDAGGGRGFDFWTQYDTVLHHISRSEPATEVKTHWVPHTNRSGGGFWAGMSGLLLLDCFWDHCGWAANYDIDMRYNNGQFGQPPSMYSHNIYIAVSCRDVDIDETWSLRSASMGFMMRPGGRITHSHAIDNGVQIQSLSGNYQSAGFVGEYTLFMGLTATSTPQRKVNDQTGLFDYRSNGNVGADVGAQHWGYRPEGQDASLIDCVAFHARDPDNLAGEAFKTLSPQLVDYGSRGYPYYENILHYKWLDSGVNNIPDLSQSQLNLITAQRFAAQELGVTTGSIGALGDYLRALNVKDRTETLWRYHEFIRAGYGPGFKDLPAVRRAAPATLSFIPDDRGEGFRADTDINWSTKDRPKNGDSIQQNGNYTKWVKFTRTLASWAFGAGSGYLEVTSGKLTVQSHADAARIHVANIGQYFAPASAHGGDYLLGGGRLCFTGAQSVSARVNGEAEMILGPSLTVPSGKSMRIDGGQCFVGWDMPSGSAVLNINGLIDIRATPIITAFGATARYRQGWPLIGEVSGMTGKLDVSYPRASSQWRVAIKDATGLPVAGEALSRKESNGEYARAFGVSSYPTCVSIQPSTLPTIRKFRSGRFVDSNKNPIEPAATVTVNLAGELALDLLGVREGSYPLIEADSINGNFSKVTTNRLAAGLTATVNKTATAVTLVVSAIS